MVVCAPASMRTGSRAVISRFFDSIKEPYLYNEITVTGESNNNSFITTGKEIISLGWKKTEEDDDEDELPVLPHLIAKDSIPIQKKDIKEKQTKPKKHFTNATILALMEKPKSDDSDGKLAGLGTPATRANIISILLARGYISQDKQKLLITDKGRFIIDTIIQNQTMADFISLRTTTAWEDQLSENPDMFLNNIKNFIINELPKIKINKKWESANLGTCPLCRIGKIYSGKQSFYCSEFSNGCQFKIWKNIANTSVTENDAVCLLQGQTTNLKTFTKKDKTKFKAKLILKTD